MVTGFLNWRCVLGALLSVGSLMAAAQQQVEIIPLRHRTLDQVIPVLQPLLEPGATLSGMNDQLIVRASRRNLEDLRMALSAIDTPQRSLRIRVSQSRESAASRQAASLSGQIVEERWQVAQPRPGGAQIGLGERPPGDGATVELRRGDSRIRAQTGSAAGTESTRVDQVVQTVDGGRAFIQVGQSLPIPLRQSVVRPDGVVLSESVVYRDVGQGFSVVPRLSGQRVSLEISPQADQLAHSSPGAINTQRLTTTVSGRLGEWIELGGSDQLSSAAGRGNLSAGGGSGIERRSIWLLVEEVR